MPTLQKRIHFTAAGSLGSLLVRALRKSWTVHIDDPRSVTRSVLEGPQQALMAFWHRHILTLLAVYHGYPIVVPVSEHEDGEYVAQVMARMGLDSVRGSTTHGSLNMIRGMFRKIEAGCSPAITPDGPKGPCYSVQPGFILLARRSGLPVHAVGVAACDAWELSSWDRFHIPKPWTTVGIAFVRAFEAGELNRKADTDEASRHLKDCMRAAQAKASALLDAD